VKNSQENSDDNGYIVEYVAIGNSVKVTAFDPKTMTEACVIGARNLPQKQLAKLAIRKLLYMLEKTRTKRE
jgi:hypothetical protein